MMIQFYLQFSMQLITRYILKLFRFLKYFKILISYTPAGGSKD